MRPWAYEELLLPSVGVGGGNSELSSLAADLALDLAELKRMQDELHDQIVRVAELEGRVHALRRATNAEHEERTDSPRFEVEIRSLPSDPVRPSSSFGRNHSLARCEGFRVESPLGVVGFVEGLRFVTRIDEPDLLEVRGGRFGRDLMLVPAEAVEDVSMKDECVVIRSASRGLEDGDSHELVNLLRRALHHQSS